MNIYVSWSSSKLRVKLVPLNMLKPPVIFTDRSMAGLLLWILLVIFMLRVCLCYTVLSVPCSLVITCWERANLLALLFGSFLVFLLLSHMLARVGCDT